MGHGSAAAGVVYPHKRAPRVDVQMVEQASLRCCCITGCMACLQRTAFDQVDLDEMMITCLITTDRTELVQPKLALNSNSKTDSARSAPFHSIAWGHAATIRFVTTRASLRCSRATHLPAPPTTLRLLPRKKLAYARSLDLPRGRARSRTAPGTYAQQTAESR